MNETSSQKPARNKNRLIIGIIIFIGLVVIASLVAAKIVSGTVTKLSNSSLATADTPVTPEPPKPVVTHVATPTPVKAVYLSSWVASSPAPLKKVMDVVDTTEVNAVVLDIKDATGRVSFLVDDKIINDTGAPVDRIKHVNEFINMLHAKNIYVIGRISTFQDPFLTKVHPDWALAKKSDSSVWTDRKGLAFLDPANKNVWDYNVALARASYNLGFDEINFDYIRYPSDGDIKNIDYKLTTDPTTGVTRTRADNIASFMENLSQKLRTESGIKTSADLFGLTTSETTDMGIGQVLERALPNFDYIAPMVYPSHYAKGEYGIANPSTHPYEIVAKAMEHAKAKIDKMHADVNLPQDVKDRVKYSQIRPWLQDFNLLGVVYTPELIRAQMKAVYDNGLDSWMMWDPANTYTGGAYNAPGTIDPIVHTTATTVAQ